MWRVLFRCLLAIATFLAAIFLAYLQLPPEAIQTTIRLPADLGHWTLPNPTGLGRALLPLAFAAILLIGARAFIGEVTAAWRANRLRRMRPLQRAAHSILSATFLRLINRPDPALDLGAWFEENEDPGLEPAEIGLSAFVVRRSPRLFFRKQLRRVGRLRLAALPKASPRIRWTKGKGIVGQVWKQERWDVVETVDGIWDEDVNITWWQWWWPPWPRARRMGLRYRDFQALRGKYKGALVVPLIGDNQEVKGVVALDLTKAGSTAVDCLYEPKVLRAMERAAVHLLGAEPGGDVQDHSDDA